MGKEQLDWWSLSCGWLDSLELRDRFVGVGVCVFKICLNCITQRVASKQFQFFQFRRRILFKSPVFYFTLNVRHQTAVWVCIWSWLLKVIRPQLTLRYVFCWCNNQVSPAEGSTDTHRHSNTNSVYVRAFPSDRIRAQTCLNNHNANIASTNLANWADLRH